MQTMTMSPVVMSGSPDRPFVFTPLRPINECWVLYPAAVHDLVILLFQLGLVPGLFFGEEFEQGLDGTGFDGVRQ